jgi:hypothetical protein
VKVDIDIWREEMEKIKTLQDMIGMYNFHNQASKEGVALKRLVKELYDLRKVSADIEKKERRLAELLCTIMKQKKVKKIRYSKMEVTVYRYFQTYANLKKMKVWLDPKMLKKLTFRRKIEYVKISALGRSKGKDE